MDLQRRLRGIWDTITAEFTDAWRYFGFALSNGETDTQVFERVAEAITGPRLIEDVAQAIRLKQAVLVSGPRGSGKSYCVWKAIEKTGLKHIFIQGNAELGRDYLVEDSLAVEVVAKEPRLTLVPSRLGALPVVRRGGPGGVKSLEEASQQWRDSDWTVLFLDELNRFSDSFLDALLSLMEEKIIVRRGEDYFVPIVVAATANPTGYDSTAKRLSPPLQARLARSVRLYQPDLDTLVLEILRSKLTAVDLRALSSELQCRMAGALLCMWGATPAGQRPAPGLAYLTTATRDLLDEAADRDPLLRTEMERMSQLAAYGPDARGINDWAQAALVRAETAKRPGPAQVEIEDLEQTCIFILPHKIRESFSDGLEPQKTELLRTTVYRIVRRCLRVRQLGSVFQTFRGLRIGHAAAGDLLVVSHVAVERIGRWRRALRVLANASSLNCLSEIVRRQLSELGALSSEGNFFSIEELRWYGDAIASGAFRVPDGPIRVFEWGVDIDEVIDDLRNAYGVGASVEEWISSRPWRNLDTSEQGVAWLAVWIRLLADQHGVMPPTPDADMKWLDSDIPEWTALKDSTRRSALLALQRIIA